MTGNFHVRFLGELAAMQLPYPTAYYACGQLIHMALRHHTPYALLFVDLDPFKLINDTYGHAPGDVVRKTVVGTEVNCAMVHIDPSQLVASKR